MSQNIQYWTKRFMEYLEIEKGRSLATLELYDRYINRFITHSKIKKPEEINADHVREFRMYLNRQTNYKGETMKKKTQNGYLISLRSFLKYLERNDVKTLPAAKIELAKAPERELDVITEDEFKRLLAAPKEATFEDIRDKAILEFLFSTGLRVAELCSLQSDLDIKSDNFTIRGKGEKLRLVFISPEARRTVGSYLTIMHKTKFKKLSGALFVMKSGERIHPRAVQRILEKRSRQAGIMKAVSPHSIRHYFATNLLQNGADIRSVQMLLGHASINTTQVYTKLSDKFLKEVHQKFHK